MDIQVELKNKLPILYGRFKVIRKNDDDLKGLQSTVKRLSDDKCLKCDFHTFSRPNFVCV